MLATQILRAKSIPGGIAARLGGEEFALVLSNTPLGTAVAHAEQLREAVAKLLLKRVGRAEYVGNVTVSIGVAHGGAEETLERLIERADEALYAAKRAGRNRVCVAGSSDANPEPGEPEPGASPR